MLRIKDEVYPRTGHESPEGEYRYSCTLSFIAAQDEVELSTPRSGRFVPGNNPVQEAGWAPGSVWTGADNRASTGIRSPDRPARSELLYQLRYPGPYAAYIGSYRRFGIAETSESNHQYTLPNIREQRRFSGQLGMQNDKNLSFTSFILGKVA